MSLSSARSRALRAAAVAALVPMVAALTAFAAPEGASRARPHVVTITARDYAFVGPDTLAAGVTTIKLLNRGKELHHVQLIRLDGGRTVKDFFDALKAGGPPPKWAREVGGPNTPAPGADSEATLDLAPGRYALVCFIPSPDNVPHVMKGMAKELVVVAPRGVKKGAAGKDAQVGMATPAVTMTLDDYSFSLSSPLVAGRTTIRVRNRARQAHEVLLVQLAPGRTAHEMVEWAEKQVGPPPGRPIGGTTGIETGGWNDVHVTLAKGDYALICFLPDAKDGKPHSTHGMIRQVTVR